MKVVITGDWHAHEFQEFATSELVYWDDVQCRFLSAGRESLDSSDVTLMNSRLLNLCNALCDMREYCCANGIDNVLMAGDMFHHRSQLNVRVLNAMYKVLESFRTNGITVIAIAGNHDDVDNSIFPESALRVFSDLITVVESPRVVILGNTMNDIYNSNVRVCCVPYSSSRLDVMRAIQEQYQAALDTPMQAIGEPYVILLCHLGITGARVGSAMYAMKDEYTLDDLMPDKYNFVACGHYHQPQMVAKNVVYPGSPIQNNFGDERPVETDLLGGNGYNGFMVLDTSNSTVDFVPLNAPRFVTITGADALDSVPANALQGCFIRAQVKPEEANPLMKALSQLTDAPPAGIRTELQKEYQQITRSGIKATQSPQEIAETYLRENWGNTSIPVEDALTVGLNILAEVMT